MEKLGHNESGIVSTWINTGWYMRDCYEKV